MQLDNFNQLVGGGIDIYGSREKIRSQIISYAKEYLELNTVDFYKTSAISYIIDTLSILSANHLFYDSVIYREFFMVEAQMSESVYNLANWIGYNVPRAKPATVDVMFTVPLTFAGDDSNFSIPNTFKAYSGDIPFLINSLYTTSNNTTAESIGAAKVTVNKSEVSKLDIPAASGTIINNNAVTVKDDKGFYKPIFIYNDGKTKTASFTLPFTQHERKVFQFLIPSSLQAYQFFSKVLEFSGMVSNIKVWVAEPKYGDKIIIDTTTQQNFNPNNKILTTGGNSTSWQQWEESEHGVYTMAPGSDNFVFVGGENKGEVFFGNGIIGRQPAPNSAITVEMYITKGEGGHVIPNTIIKGDKIGYSVTPTYDSSGNSIGSQNTNKVLNISYKITNNVQSSGGSNTPSIPEIKRQAIINLRSKKRLVSEEDYNDINTIVDGQFPVIEAYPILKRSDIKINEIMTFVRLMYHDEYSLPQIVPTRNVKFPVYDPTFTDGKYTIVRNSKILLNNEYYQTLYNITIDSATMMANYDYVLQNVSGSPVSLYQEEPYSWYQQYVYIPVNTIDFNVDLPSEIYTTSSSSSTPQTIYALKIKVNVNHELTLKPNDYLLSEFRCRMITKWDTNQEYSEVYAKYTIDPNMPDGYNKKYSYFEFEIPNYLNIPSEVQRFEFVIDGYGLLRDKDGNFIDEDGDMILDGNGDPITSSTVEGWMPIVKCYSDAMVRKDLSDVMVSSVTKTNYWDSQTHPNSTKYEVHNVPTILSSYLDDGGGGGVLNRADNLQYPNFEITVMQNLIKNLDISNKRMLTDFINIKFPDTYGQLNNLKYNPVDYTVKSRFHTPFRWENPDGIFPNSQLTSSSSGSSDDLEFYIVNGEVPGYSQFELASYIDNIAQLYKGVTGVNGGDVWYLTKPRRGMYVKVLDEFDNAGDYKIIVYNGDKWIDVQNFTIPLNVKLTVEMDPSINISQSTLKQNIKDAIIKHFSPYMGTQKELDRSEINKLVREISGVVYCEVIEPAIDIRFKYDIRINLTQQQLLDYTPQYVGMVEDLIQIEII